MATPLVWLDIGVEDSWLRVRGLATRLEPDLSVRQLEEGRGVKEKMGGGREREEVGGESGWERTEGRRRGGG